jgi:hypothetical protein
MSLKKMIMTQNLNITMKKKTRRVLEKVQGAKEAKVAA